MEEQQNLEELNRKISQKLLDSMYLLEVLNDLADGEGKETTVLNIIKSNIKSAFLKTEQCRKMISFAD